MFCDTESGRISNDVKIIQIVSLYISLGRYLFAKGFWIHLQDKFWLYIWYLNGIYGIFMIYMVFI
jgi:hypothetical protein